MPTQQNNLNLISLTIDWLNCIPLLLLTIYILPTAEQKIPPQLYVQSEDYCFFFLICSVFFFENNFFTK